MNGNLNFNDKKCRLHCTFLFTFFIKAKDRDEVSDWLQRIIIANESSSRNLCMLCSVSKQNFPASLVADSN